MTRADSFIMRHNARVERERKAIDETAAYLKRIRLSEKGFTRQVIELARWHRWKTAHFRPAEVKCRACSRKRRTSNFEPRNCPACKGRGYVWRTAVEGDGKGFLDLVLVRPPRVIFAELKRDGETITDPDQQDWYDAWHDCAVELYLWRPADFDQIEEILT